MCVPVCLRTACKMSNSGVHMHCFMQFGVCTHTNGYTIPMRYEHHELMLDLLHAHVVYRYSS